MFRKLCCLLAVLAVFTMTVETNASELVRFIDGRYLEIVSHSVKGGMIRLTLKSGAAVGLPTEKVEKIERGGMVVFAAAQTEAGKLPDSHIASTSVRPQQRR